MSLGDKIVYYDKHRKEFAKVVDILFLLDYLYTRPATPANLREFNKTFDKFSSKLEHFLFGFYNVL